DLQLVLEPVTRDVPDPDVDDRRDGDDAQENERRELLAPRSADAECPANRRLVQRICRRAAQAARAVVWAVAAVVDRAAIAGGDAHAGLPASRRNTSSSDVSRVVNR